MQPKKIILCVDRDEEELSLLAFLLVTNRYCVLRATSSQEAAAMFYANPRIDLVIADEGMPRIAGVSLIKHLKGIRSYIPMMWLTKGPADAIKSRWADAVVSKQLPRAELLERIRFACVRKRRPRKGAQYKISTPST